MQGAAQLSDLTVRESVILAPLAAIVLLVGVYPGPLLVTMDACVAKLVELTSHGVPFDLF